MNRNHEMFISDILESMNKIERYISGLSLESFKKNELIIDAVVRNFEIIGEAAKNIPEDIRNTHSEIPWKKMIGLRNYTAHEYFGIDLAILWDIAKINIPETKPQILSLAGQLKSKK